MNTDSKKRDLVNATEFARLLGCNKSAVTLMLATKLTEGNSYLKEGRTIFIDVDRAKRELMVTVKWRTCRNRKLFEFLFPPKTVPGNRLADNSVVGRNATSKSLELAKNRLRRGLMKEQIIRGILKGNDISTSAFMNDSEITDNSI